MPVYLLVGAVEAAVDAGAALRLNEVAFCPGGGQVSFTDPVVGIAPGASLRYSYGLTRDGREVARSGEITIAYAGATPAAFALRQNYPNPFNPVTTIVFDLPRPGAVTLRIYDLNGRLIRTLVDGELPAATHQRQWDGTNDQGRPVPSGMYYCGLESPSSLAMRKMTLLK